MKIGYKIVAAVMAVCVIAVLVFAPLISLRAKSTALQILGFIGQLSKNEEITQLMEKNDGKLPEYLTMEVSISDFFSGEASTITEMISSFATDQTEQTMARLQRFIAPGLALLVSLALIAVCAILIVIFAFAAKDNRKVIFTSMAGIGMCFMVKYCFETIATPILNGEVTLESLSGSFWMSLIAEVTDFGINSVFWFIPVIFGAIILWTVLYNYTLPEKDKLQRKIMLGEATQEVPEK